jgi:hypothetical protein
MAKSLISNGFQSFFISPFFSRLEYRKSHVLVVLGGVVISLFGNLTDNPYRGRRNHDIFFDFPIPSKIERRAFSLFR